MMPSSDTSGQNALPLFYQRPEPLTAAGHANLRLSTVPDFRFSADTNAVPVMISEMPATGRFYPIVFSGNPVMPVAVLGLQQRNLFVAEDGSWDDERTYIPAYVRRYPFTFMIQNSLFALGVDMACARLIKGGKGYKSASALFENGNPTPFTQEAMRFCGALQSDHVATRDFAAALEDMALLTEQRAIGTAKNGRQFSLQGFRVVDQAKFQGLADATVLDWHRKGWLSLVQAHIASQHNWTDLLEKASLDEAAGEENRHA